VFGAESGRHHGPVYSVQRHPFAPKYFASIGDWTARVWMEDIKTPLLTTPYSKSYLSGGCWSPTRPGVLFTAKTDGTLDVFDLFYKQSEPVFSTRVVSACVIMLCCDHMLMNDCLGHRAKARCLQSKYTALASWLPWAPRTAAPLCWSSGPACQISSPTRSRASLR